MQEIHKDRLKILASDETLIKALEEFLFINVSKEIPEVKEAFDDTRLGQEYRAFIKAKKIIVDSMRELRGMKINNNINNNKNRAI